MSKDSSSTMKAWAQSEPGTELSLLSLQDVPVPEVKPGDLLVRVKGVATNPVDSKIRASIQSGKTTVVGWDAAGVVEAVGADVKHFKVGDDVYFAGDVTRGGCFAELVAVDERVVARKPVNLDWATAACIPLTALTAWEGLVEVAGLSSGKGKTLLIVNGAGGVGSILIQVAKRVLEFDQVVATASRADTIAWCKEQGADLVINHHEDLQPQLDAAGLKGVDVIYNCTEADRNFDKLPALLNPLGKLVLLTGPFEPVKLCVWGNHLYDKRCTVGFELMFSRIIYDDAPETQGKILAEVARLIEAGVINPHVRPEGSRFSIKDLPKALELQDSGKAIGKLAVDVDSWTD